MIGKVKLSDTVYIDFDMGHVYESGKLVHELTNLQYGVLEYLILNAGHTVSVNSIIENVWGYDYEGENANQNVRDIISQIRSIPTSDDFFTGNNYIHTNRGRGYFIPSNITSAHLDSNSKSEFDFCKKFLHSGATALINKNLDEILNEIHKISKLFIHNTLIKHELETIDHQSSIADFIIKLISDLNYNTPKTVLKIKGPLGSYKNRLLQYIYLYISIADHHILPFYIDISMYEKIKSKPDSDFKNDLKQAIEEDLAYIKRQIDDNDQKVPLVILDGIRDFSCGKDFLYSYLQKVFEKIDCKLFVSVDTDFTNNPRHKFRVHPFITTDYEYFIRIKSLELYRRDESIDFIKDTICLLGIKLPSLLTPELIYDKLVKLNLISIDAYWFKNLIEIITNNIMRDEFTIVDLYDALCRKSLQNSATIDSAASLAYEFEYGDMSFSDNEFFFDDRWKVIRKHRSMLDYLLARNYIIQFEALQNCLKSGDVSQNLHFFNFVLPKSITRFVTILFNEIDDYENTILSIAEKYYDSMSTFGKTELIFWLGRLKNPNRKAEGVKLLQNYKLQQFAKYNSINFKTTDSNEIKKQAFLLRGIFISLIQSDDKASSKEYFDLLLNDKLSNKINRGFHLEYYGDKPYIPSKTRLDFEDDISKGENTFNSLCIYISDCLRNNKVNCNTILELFTLCSLIQARIEGNKTDSFNINTYLSNTTYYIKWILKQRYLNDFQSIKHYFDWILHDINAVYIDGMQLHNNANIFNLYSQLGRIERTGWLDTNVKKAETISDHMYHCWLIGLLYLPENFADPDYDKTKILKMLLIHDIGETITGDIPTPEKEPNKAFYDSQENRVMQDFFLIGTYPSMANLKDFQECWDEWYSDNTINSDIAKDIDEIQAVFKLCEYYKNDEIQIDTDEFKNWYDSIYNLRTDIVKEIANTIIRNNPKFYDIVANVFGQ